MEVLDPQVKAFIKAIRQVESGGNYTARSKDGSFGAYQFIKPTWDATAKKYGVTSAWEKATPQEQDKVAYMQVKEWKDKGYNVGQVASMWNAGAGRPNAYVENVKSTNTSGVKYDVAGYAKKVATFYHQFKAGGDFAQNNQQEVTPEVVKEKSQPKGVLGNLAVGATKGLLSTITGLGQLVLKAGTLLPGEQPMLEEAIKTGDEFKRRIAPDNTAQNIGHYGEQIAELFTPTGIESGALKVFSYLPKLAEKAPLIAKVAVGSAKLATKAVASAIDFGGKTYLQTGGDTKKAKDSGIVAGAITAATGVVGGVLKTAGVPEYLYGKIFRKTTEDALNALKKTGIENIAKTDPELYKRLVSEGIIKVTEKGSVIDENMARQALDRGLKGSVTGMAKEVVRQTMRAELKVRDIVKNIKGLVDLPYAQLKNVIAEVAENYKNVGQGEVALTAKNFLTELEKNGGKVSSETLLNMRRFFDGLRRESSYGQPLQSLSMSAKNFKYWSDILRGKLNGLPGMQDVMKDYSFYINALDDLSVAAKKAGNNNAISFMDALFADLGFRFSTPIGVGVGLGRVLGKLPAAQTGLGQLIEKGSSKLTTPLKAVGSYIGGKVTGSPSNE